jgi:transcriptional regulator with XRE-family HTH domain
MGRGRRDSTAAGAGIELKRAPEQVRLTANEFGQILGWSPSKVSRIESGGRVVSEVNSSMGAHAALGKSFRLMRYAGHNQVVYL